MNLNIENLIGHLPNEFLFGTAINPFQTEGNIYNNTWHSWEKMGLVREAGIAADFWNKYEFWINKAAEVGNCFRLGIEWSRIEPSKGVFDMDALEHYRKILLYCRSKGLKTVLTVHHFTDPIWVAKNGGWLNTETEDLFQRYAMVCSRYLGDMVDYWITINEPQIYCGSRLGGIYPEKYNIKRALTVLFIRMANAHRKAYQAIRVWQPNAKIGTAQNIQFFEGRNIVNKIISKIANAIWNYEFLRRTIKYHDFIGVNYYGRIKFPLENKDVLANLKPYAPGLGIMLQGLWARFHLPIMITENGLLKTGENEEEKIWFIADHLSECNKAILSGVKLIGWLFWTLVDTSTEEGDYRMGLYTLEGKPKESAKFMANLLSVFNSG